MNINELKEWFENLTPQSLDNINHFYAEKAFFKDPFNELEGIDDIKHIFIHMFENTESSKFTFIDIIENTNSCFITWDYDLSLKGSQYRIHGSSHLKFEEGRIIYHRDYWDVGEELLLKVPIIKSIYGSFRKKFSIKR